MFNCDICDFKTDIRLKYAGHRSGHVRRGELEKKKKITDHICEICGDKFETGFKLGGHKHTHSLLFENIKGDVTRKLRILKERSHCCEVCNLTEWQGQPIPIELDHVDGNPENNAKSNLRLICPNCHAQTPTYKGRNMGKVQNTKRQLTMKKYYGKYR